MADGRMRFLAEVHDAQLNMNPTQDELQAILDRRIGGIRVLRSHWLTGFEIRHARVPAYRWGRVFLAGDAAHIHSPAGGQGMNTGMQDAFNLAWKLAAVIDGKAGENLLNSYEAERLPIADGVIAFTDRLTKAGTLSGLPRRIRDVAIRMVSRVPAARRYMAETATEVNVGYRNSTIAVGRRHGRAKVSAGEHFPHIADADVQKQLGAVLGPDTGHVILTIDDTHVTANDTVIDDPNGVVAQRFGLKGGGVVVIRPDSYIGAVAALDDTTTIAKYFDTVRS
jgi:hypothetical protein